MTDLRALALLILDRKRLSQAHKPAGTVKVESAQRVNPSVPLSQPLRARDTGQLAPEAGTALRDTRGTVGTCLQCGGGLGPAAREITVRSTGDGQLASVHFDCMDQWQRKGPPQ